MFSVASFVLLLGHLHYRVTDEHDFLPAMLTQLSRSHSIADLQYVDDQYADDEFAAAS